MSFVFNFKFLNGEIGTGFQVFFSYIEPILFIWIFLLRLIASFWYLIISYIAFCFYYEILSFIFNRSVSDIVIYGFITLIFKLLCPSFLFMKIFCIVFLYFSLTFDYPLPFLGMISSTRSIWDVLKRVAIVLVYVKSLYF